MDHVYYSKNGENWIDFSNIPLKVWRGKQVYDWRNCTEWVEVPFEYEGLQDIMLMRHDSSDKYPKHYVEISYECCSVIIEVFGLKRVQLKRLLNKVPVKRPDLVFYFKNGFQNAKEHPYKGNYKHCLKCVNCGFEKTMFIYQLTDDGFACPMCSTNTSFPERFTRSLLDEIGLEYETQKRFEGENWRFDFYIPDLKLIIEVHGVQHFQNAWTSKDEVVANDNKKRKFIKFELGLNYAAIDISVSEPYYAWSMLEQNDFLEPYMRDVDYDVVVERCNDLFSNRDYIDVMRDYERGMSLSRLSREYKIGVDTIRRILLRSGKYVNKGTFRAVVCVTTGERFENATQAGRELNLQGTGINKNCRGNRKSAGITPDGRKRVWMYLEDYEKQLNVN